MRRPDGCALLLLLPLVACGGSPPPLIVGDLAAAPLDGGDRDGSSMTGADLGSSSGGPLFPFAVGRSWTYSGRALGSGGVCGTTMVQTVTSANPVRGRAAYQVTTHCPPPKLLATASYSLPDRDEVDNDHTNQWVEVLPAVESDGSTWPCFGNTCTLRQAGTVTVAAGTFPDCWTVHQAVTGQTLWSTYCRGVGVVRQHYDQAGNGGEFELTSKSF